MRLTIFIVTVLFLYSSFAFSFQKIESLSVSAEGIEKLDVYSGAGFLKVYGSEELEEIEVSAEIIVKGMSEEKSKRFVQKYVNLTLNKRGTKAILTSKFRQSFSLFSWGEKVINLTVNVPSRMQVYISDGSGDMDIKNISGDIEIKDGSGGIEAQNINGNMEIDDGSGGIDMEDIFGDISIDDGSGSIFLENIHGEVVVSDGSGSINIDGVEKDVIIKSAGSGGVNIRNVKGKISR